MAEKLSEIRQLTRNLCNIQDTNELSNTTLDSYINNIYVNRLSSVVTMGLSRIYRLGTIPYIDKYAISSEYQIIRSIRINGEDMDFYTDEDAFRNVYPDSWRSEIIGTGTGAILTFAYTLTTTVVPESIIVGDGIEIFTDDGNGVLTGDAGGTGTINYATGALSVTFNANPILSAEITISYSIYKASQPLGVLYNNADTSDGGEPEIVLRPIPNRTYSIDIYYEATPSPLVNVTDEPLKKSWADLIAYMTAIEICNIYGNFDQAQQLSRGYSTALDVVFCGDVKTMSNNRPIPRW